LRCIVAPLLPGCPAGVLWRTQRARSGCARSVVWGGHGVSCPLL